LPALEAGRFGKITAVLHQGACSDTMNHDGRYMMNNNYRYSLRLLDWCQQHRVPLIYASSAAVYGASRQFVEQPEFERPLNVYGYSKLLFDQVVRRRLNDLTAPVVGLRYFNVYGAREEHKGRMASVAFHHAEQLRQNGYVTLFEGSHGYAHGAQRRDFIEVGDVVKVNLFFLDTVCSQPVSGVFNCGTGRAQAFNDIASTTINTARQLQGQERLTLEQMVEQQLLRYVPFPPGLKEKYQAYTQADINPLREVGYSASFASVEQGVAQYVKQLYSPRV
jgi:ADP-L-glycero-D-manno-heptose 6-epimerase